MSVWGWRYHTQRDERVRPTHEELEGATFQRGSEADAVFPPWEWGCRCWAEWIDDTDAPEEGEELPPEVLRDLAENDYPSPALGLEYDPDLSGFDPRLLGYFARDQEES